MTTQNMLVPNLAANDGWAASAVGLQDNGIYNISGKYAGAYDSWVWMRFEITANIAQGSTVSSLILRVACAEDDSSSTWETDICLNEVAAAANPTSYGDLIGKAYTTGTRFTNTAIANGVYEEFDITAEGQELVNTTALTAGDYVLVAMKFVTGTNQDRTFISRDNGTSTDPELNWTYSSSIQAAVPAGTISLTGVAPTVRKSAPVVVGSVTFAGVAPTVPTAIQAAVVVGTVTFTGITPDTRHSAPVVVGTVTLTGVSPTSTHRTAVSVGTIALTSVALTSVHYAGVSIGSVAIAGVVPGSTHRAAVVVGSAVFMGVALGSRHTAAVSVGSVVFGFGVHVASIQDINFNGSTIGSALVMFGASPGLFDANPAGDDLTGWQTAVNTLVFPLTATVSLITGGFRITFADTDFHPAITISVDGTNLGLTTITQTQIGGNYFPVSVRKDVGVSVGTFALTGVLPATRHRAAVEVGSVVFAGVTPTANYGIAVPGPFIAVAWANWQPDDKAGTNWQPGDVAGDSYQPGDKAGTNL